MTASCRNLQFASCLVSQQQLLERASRRAGQATPLVDRHENRCVSAAPGDELRSLLETSLKHLAEPRLCGLDRPCPHENLQTDYRTGLYEQPSLPQRPTERTRGASDGDGVSGRFRS